MSENRAHKSQILLPVHRPAQGGIIFSAGHAPQTES
jgi:hypothetical protein